jgi:hypothetical protein
MSMHMIKGVYAPKSKRRKAKKLDMSKVEVQWRQYNKEMRRKHMHSCQFDTLDEYVAYISGKLKPKKREFIPYEPTPSAPQQNKIPSQTASPVHGIPQAGRRKERQVYTGDYIVGIATMHKSNAVPITNQEQAIEIARMAK